MTAAACLVVQSAAAGLGGVARAVICPGHALGSASCPARPGFCPVQLRSPPDLHLPLPWLRVHRLDPFSKKDWYDVKAPTMFTNRQVGKTLVTRTTGIKIASEGLKGRVIEASLADLNQARGEPGTPGWALQP